MRPFLFLARLSVLGLAGLAGCTLLILQDAAVDPHCDDDDGCAAGLICTDGVCAAAASTAPPLEGEPIGPEGGTVESPLGDIDATLVVPAGALTDTVRFEFRARSATLPHDNFTATGPFIEIVPQTTFAVPARLSLQGDGDLFRQPDSGDSSWERIEAAGDDVAIDETGTFARGTFIDGGTP